MSYTKKELDKRPQSPSFTKDGAVVAFDGDTGKVLKEATEIPIELLSKLEANKVVVTELDGSLATSDITQSQLGQLDNLIDIINSEIEAKSRFAISCGFDGSASSGRYLEFNSNVDSNSSGFVSPRNCRLKEISLVIESSSTVTFSVIKYSGVETTITTVETVSSRKGIVINLDLVITTNDEIRVKCTSGSGSRPIVYLFFIFY